ncbi:hypothetical protein BN2475_1240006 [Paraburkholderia ribeironis]|uniref:Uncharacterized protein n=1 Tax=Paraburkholderia ribeironis TaxID=1247936 RepID=A0A1N7SNX2_9BURK|nr:hypothetical protein BN2475_1240006 [Paraburkholderia ribeironis]
MERAIRLCLSYPAESRVFNGVLAVVDPNNDPSATLNYFHGLHVSNIDFLLPDAHYTAPPHYIHRYSHEKLLTFLSTDCGFSEGAEFVCGPRRDWLAGLARPHFAVRILPCRALHASLAPSTDNR